MSRTSTLYAALLTAALGAAGCRNLNLESGVLTCSPPPESACPSGYVCHMSDDKCYKIGADAAVSSGGQGGGGGKGASGQAGSGGRGGGGQAGGGQAGGNAPDGGVDAPTSPDGAVTCSAQQKLCSGACVSIDDPKYGCGPTSCDGSSCPNAAGATLVCQAGACVVGTCGTGTKNCGGLCVAVSDPTYGCGATSCDASTCPTPGAGGTVVCQGGACVIGTCPADFKKCGTKCVAVADPTYGCGPATCDATSCPAAGSGTLICQAGACVVGTCGAGTKKCGDKCVTTDANNGCADTTRCTPCATGEACMGSPTTCTCTPNCTGKCSGADGCGGTCPNNCVAPQTCGGGGTANACGCTPNCSGKCSGSDGCGGTCPNKCVSPQTCGGGGTANACGCTPNCSGKCSGPDSCGGTCPNNCGAGQVCGGATANVCCTPNCSGKCGGPNGCGGTCPNNCPAGQTCGALTTNVCGCKPSSAMCGTRMCGTVPDGCTGTVSCGACSPGKTCNSSGACVCPTSYSWNFDSNDLAGWHLSADAGSSGSIGTAASPGNTGSAMRIANASFTAGNSISVQVTLCSGTAVSFPSGFTFKVDVRFESTSGIPFGGDGMGGGGAGILAETDQGSFLVNNQQPAPLGMWQTLSRPFPMETTSSVTVINLRFDPLSDWTGTIYIDNISVQ